MEAKLVPPRGLFLGAALMYLLDPERGHRRRAILTDKALKVRRKAGRALRVSTHDLENRLQGLLAQAGVVLSHDEPDDRLVEARVRARLGRVCSHPRAIEVSVDQGVVTLSGPVLLDEWRRVLRAVKRTRDLREVNDRLEIHTVADIPALQGGHTRGHTLRETLNGPWQPATRLVVASAGAAAAIGSLALHGVARRATLAAGLILVGSAVGREILAQQNANGLEEARRVPWSYDELEESVREFEYIS